MFIDVILCTAITDELKINRNELHSDCNVRVWVRAWENEFCIQCIVLVRITPRNQKILDYKTFYCFYFQKTNINSWNNMIDHDGMFAYIMITFQIFSPCHKYTHTLKNCDWSWRNVCIHYDYSSNTLSLCHKHPH